MKGQEEFSHMKPRVFLTRELPAKVLDYLKEHTEPEMNEDDRILTKGELIERIKGKDALLCNVTDKIDAEVMDSNSELKVIANYAVGYNNIDIAAATKRKIPVTNTPGVLTEATADMAWSLLMAVSRRVVEGHKLVESRSWQGWAPMQMLGRDVSGTTLGIIGFGRIGQAVARRAYGFRMNVLYWNRTRLDPHEEKQYGVKYCSLDELLGQSDFVSLHLAYTPETHHIIGERELAMMKPTAYLINTARGAHVDEEALVNALRTAKIAGAGLDVYENEPQLNEGLFNLDNVILAPHLGSATVTTRTQMGIMAANNLLSVFNGMVPPNIVNKEIYS
jgi:glyoxylate reductase